MKNKLKKVEPPEHFVFVDTNILWHEDKSLTVHPDFDLFWHKYCKDFKLKLLIPEVVKGELWFQQTTSAIKRLEKINDEVKEIDKITNKFHKHNISENKIKTSIESKIDRNYKLILFFSVYFVSMLFSYVWGISKYLSG